MTTSTQQLSSVAVFLLCSCILLVSLFTANRLQTGQHTRLPTTNMYVSEEILPDNILYVPLMVRDRVRLVTTPKEEQIFMKLEYAEARYQSAQALLEKNQESLAITTMTKSQKYLLQTVYEVRDNKQSYTPEQRQQVKTALSASLIRLEQMQTQVTGDASALGALQAESSVVFEQFDIL